MSFAELGLSEEVLKAIEESGYTNPTPIQQQGIPLVLEGRDVIGASQTGTGKTAAFALPTLSKLSPIGKPQCLVLEPTRELAHQVAESFEHYGKHTGFRVALLHGGVGYGQQVEQLERGADVVVATPGRLIDLFYRATMRFGALKVLILDEVDRMLDMGFIPDVERIAGLLPRMRQTLFFSATLSDDIQNLGSKFVMNPKIVEVAPPSTTAETVAQHIVWTDVRSKRQVLRDILRHESVKNAVVFCNRKRDIAILVKSLKRHGFSAVALHGDMTQSARLDALQRFKDGEVPLMIASDVAARGLDIAGLSHVFNFDVPSHAEDYVHRIGRTGRAGKSGRAFSIAASKDDHKYVGSIETLIGKPIPLIKIINGKVDDGDSKLEADATKTDSKKAGGIAKDSKAVDQMRELTANKSTKTDGLKSSTGKSRTTVKSKNRNRGDELPSPPDCSGNTLAETGHVPAFLRR